MAFPCPRGDNGICGGAGAKAVAFLVWDGEVSVLTGRLLQQVISRADLAAAERIGKSESRALRLGSDPRGWSRGVRLLGDSAPQGKWLYVECKPCGDFVKVPVP